MHLLVRSFSIYSLSVLMIWVYITSYWCWYISLYVFIDVGCTFLLCDAHFLLWLCRLQCMFVCVFASCVLWVCVLCIPEYECALFLSSWMHFLPAWHNPCVSSILFSSVICLDHSLSDTKLHSFLSHVFPDNSWNVHTRMHHIPPVKISHHTILYYEYSLHYRDKSF